MDISKCFREPLGIRDNESRLQDVTEIAIFPLEKSLLVLVLVLRNPAVHTTTAAAAAAAATTTTINYYYYEK